MPLAGAATEAALHWILALFGLLLTTQGPTGDTTLEFQVYAGGEHVYDVLLKETEGEQIEVYRLSEEGDELVGVLREGSEPETVDWVVDGVVEDNLALEECFAPELMEQFGGLSEEGGEAEFELRGETYRFWHVDGELHLEQGELRMVVPMGGDVMDHPAQGGDPEPQRPSGN